jgi:polyisoprenoid-binding protein YceI
MAIETWRSDTTHSSIGYRVVGDLTPRDVTREGVLETELLGRVTDPFGTERLAFSARTRIIELDVQAEKAA